MLEGYCQAIKGTSKYARHPADSHRSHIDQMGNNLLLIISVVDAYIKQKKNTNLDLDRFFIQYNCFFAKRWGHFSYFISVVC